MTGLVQDTSYSDLAIRSVRRDAVSLGGRELRASFAIGTAGLIEDWGVGDISALDAAAMDRLLETRPDVILLGTGQTRHPLEPALLYRCLSRGVGIEVMDNAAAARTYNVLLAEERNVLAAFILPA